MNKSLATGIFITFLATGLGAAAQNRITPAEVAKYVGKDATVCGKVVSTAYASQAVGRPTFLNFEQPYPKQPFNIVIWGAERNNFSPPPEKAYAGKKICVTGEIRKFRDEPPRIVVTKPSQITID